MRADCFFGEKRMFVVNLKAPAFLGVGEYITEELAREEVNISDVVFDTEVRSSFSRIIGDKEWLTAQIIVEDKYTNALLRVVEKLQLPPPAGIRMSEFTSVFLASVFLSHVEGELNRVLHAFKTANIPYHTLYTETAVDPKGIIKKKATFTFQHHKEYISAVCVLRKWAC